MMTKGELETLGGLTKKFNADCERVRLAMEKYNMDYYYIDYWRYDEHGTVFGEGTYGRINVGRRISVAFNANLLTYTDDELSKYVDELIEQKHKKEELEKKQYEEQKRLEKIKLFEELKKELNM